MKSKFIGIFYKVELFVEEEMGCPVHIWAPLMALILPIVRSVKSFLFSRKQKNQVSPDASAMHRFKPISQSKK